MVSRELLLTHLLEPDAIDGSLSAMDILQPFSLAVCVACSIRFTRLIRATHSIHQGSAKAETKTKTNNNNSRERPGVKTVSPTRGAPGPLRRAPLR